MAHLPALKKLEEKYMITGVVNSSIQSALATTKANQLDDKVAFSDMKTMVNEGDIDAVVVSVKVPNHYELVKPALESNKDVFCEWPLGNGLAEAEELASIARSKGLKTMVGLQARKAPSILKAKELVESGALGIITSVSLVGNTGNWGHKGEDSRPDYLEQEKNGANLVTIPAGHALDALTYIVGEMKHLQASMTTLFPTVKMLHDGKETGQIRHRDVADSLVVQGSLSNGALVSAHFRGGNTLGATDPFRLEIIGTKGDILITGSSVYVEMSLLKIHFNDGKETQDLTMKYDPIVDNVKGLFDAFATVHGHQPAQLSSSHGFPTFDDAVIRHKMIAAIYRSSKNGTRESYM